PRPAAPLPRQSPGFSLQPTGHPPVAPWLRRRSDTGLWVLLAPLVARARAALRRLLAQLRTRLQPPGCAAAPSFHPTPRPRRSPVPPSLARTASWFPGEPPLLPASRSTHLAAAPVLHPGGKRPAPHSLHTVQLRSTSSGARWRAGRIVRRWRPRGSSRPLHVGH